MAGSGGKSRPCAKTSPEILSETLLISTAEISSPQNLRSNLSPEITSSIGVLEVSHSQPQGGRDRDRVDTSPPDG